MQKNNFIKKEDYSHRLHATHTVFNMPVTADLIAQGFSHTSAVFRKSKGARLGILITHSQLRL